MKCNVLESKKTAADLKRMSQKRKPLPAAPGAVEKEKITFDCEYYDKRTVQTQKNVTFDQFVQLVAYTFEVEKLTILYNGQYIESQADLDAMLAENKQRYELALYDPY
jgi:hypothetical protein